MRNYLLIHFSSLTVDWAIFDTTGKILEYATQVSLASVPKQPAWVLIPGTDCWLTQIEVPSHQRQRIIQAVPYALEEFLTEETEALHFAVGNRERTSGLISVVVISRTRLEAYLHQLNVVGITPTVMMPDILAVPKPPSAWGILLAEEFGLVRTGLETGFAIEPSHLLITLQKAIQEQGSPEYLAVFKDNPVGLVNLDSLAIPLQESYQELGKLAWLARGVVDNHNPLNLLQGPYRPVNRLANSLRPWRLTLGLLILWGSLLGMAEIIKYQRLQQQHQALVAAIEKIYQDTFPQARKIVNPRLQMEQQLKSLRDHRSNQDEHFLSWFTQLAVSLKPQENFKVKRIDYHQGVFELQLEVTDWPVLDELKKRLEQVGLTAKIQSAIHRNHQITSQVRIQPKKDQQ